MLLAQKSGGFARASSIRDDHQDALRRSMSDKGRIGEMNDTARSCLLLKHKYYSKTLRDFLLLTMHNPSNLQNA